MENNEIITNEVTEEIAETAAAAPKKGLKTVGVVAGVTVLACVAYRYIGKPVYRWLKGKRKKAIVVEQDDSDLEEIDE